MKTIANSQQRPDVVIVGAGVVGASVAFHLTERGAGRVLLLEREARQGLGSTGRATGGVRSQFETDVNIEMSRWSVGFFENCDFDCGYEPRGYLFFATRESELEYLRRNVARQTELGVRGVRLVGPETIAELVPGMECGDILGGSFGATDGFIDPLAVMRGFTERALANGAGLRCGAAVERIETEGGRVTGVVAGGELIECGAVVICAGAWSARLAATAGVDLPVEPLKRQIIWAESPRDLPAGLPMVIDLGSGFHFRPAKGSRREVLFACPDRDERPSFDTEFDPSFIPRVYERARARAGFLAETKPVPEKCRAGLYENTPDHHAILGGCGVAGLYLAVGFSGHGVMHSPATGRALAGIILDGEPDLPFVAPLGLERFERGEPLRETAFI